MYTGKSIGHYSEYVAASKSAGVKHLGDEAAKNTTHSTLLSKTGMPGTSSPTMGSAMPSPQMDTVPGDVMQPVNASTLPKGTIIR
jgi:hypothetical protein